MVYPVKAIVRWPAARLAAVLGLLLALPGLVFAVQAQHNGQTEVTAAAAGAWRVETADAPRWFAQPGSRSLALDAAGNAHIAYGDDHLYYAWWDSPGWRYQTVDAAPGVGQGAALVLAADGRPHIGYVDALGRQVKYAHWTGAAWQIEIVAAGVDVRAALALVLDSQGQPHMSYCDSQGGALRYARRAAAGWQLQTVAASAGGGVAMAVDAADRPHIVYGEGTVAYARWTGSAWEIEPVDSNQAGAARSMILDSAGRPAVAYTARNAQGYHELRYARRPRTGWEVQVVDTNATLNVGLEPSLRLDKAGAARISYGADDSLKYARWTGSDWVRERVDRIPARFTSLMLDASDKPQISYLAGDSLKLAQRPGLDWQIQTVDTRRATGAFTALALDSAGQAHISYRDSAGGALRYARDTGAGWALSLVDGLPGIAAHTALAVDGAGAPAIAYVAYPDPWQPGVLKYARWTGSAWALQTVAADIGSLDRDGLCRPGLQIARAGTPYISYRSAAEGTIKLAHWTGAAWATETVAGPSQFGEYTALALDDQGNPAVLYQDSGRAQLALAQKAGEAWQTSVVDEGWYVGAGNGLAFDGAGAAHVCYAAQIGETLDLRYAYRDGAAWQIATLVVGAPVAGEYCSIAVDSTGAPHISFYDGTAQNLRYAQRTTAGWDIEIVDGAGNVGAYASLALDANDRPHISYFDATNLDLKVAAYGELPPTPTPTPTATLTPSLEPTSTPTVTPTPTATLTPSPEPTGTPTVTPTASPTPSMTASPSPTATLTPTATASPRYIYLPLVRGG